jgi:O-antigen ligase
MVLLAPLFIWPAAQDAYLLPKEVFLRVGILLLTGAVLVAAFLGVPLRIPLKPVNLVLVLLVGWQFLSILWAQAPVLAREEAIRTLSFVALAFAFQSTVMDDRRRLIVLAGLLVASATVIALWVLAVDFLSAFLPGMLSVRSNLGDWRDALSTASLGNTSHIGDFLVAGFLVALAMLFSVQGRAAVLLTLVSLWLLAAALIVTWSVHSNLSLIVASLLWLWMMRDWRSTDWLRRRLLRVIPAALGWVFAVLFFVVDHPLNPHGSDVWAGNALAAQQVSGDPATEASPMTSGIFGQAFSSPRWKEGGPTRLVIWLNTLEMIRQRPVLGWGVGAYTFVYPGIQSELALRDEGLAPYVGLWTNAAHNEVLQTWSETGPVGLFLLVTLIAAALYALLSAERGRSYGNDLLRATVAAMILAWSLQALMNFPLELPIGTALLFILVSIPATIPGRGGDWNLDMPVERPYPGLRLGIMLRNMTTPLEIRAEGNLGDQGNRIAAGVIACLAVAMAIWATFPLVASVHYRPAYEAIRTPGFWEDPIRTAAAKARARRALAWHPGFADCRSALTELLVRTEDFEQALPHIELLRQRLNATEVYIREALAREALGDQPGADLAWSVVFERQPHWGQVYPQAYERVVPDPTNTGESASTP